MREQIAVANGISRVRFSRLHVFGIYRARMQGTRRVFVKALVHCRMTRDEQSWGADSFPHIMFPVLGG